jgi:dUTP pyrophosphatase
MIQFKRTSVDAVVPKKAGENEVGYDLTAITLDKPLSENTYMFDTGIQVKPPDGYYLEIVPRSSIVKTGYMLANSVGIIDPTYRGNLKIVLTKTSKMSPPLSLPFTKCQLVLRKMETSSIVDIGDVEWEQTTRGSGGFGSTDLKEDTLSDSALNSV